MQKITARGALIRRGFRATIGSFSCQHGRWPVAGGRWPVAAALSNEQQNQTKMATGFFQAGDANVSAVQENKKNPQDSFKKLEVPTAEARFGAHRSKKDSFSTDTSASHSMMFRSIGHVSSQKPGGRDVHSRLAVGRALVFNSTIFHGAIRSAGRSSISRG